MSGVKKYAKTQQELAESIGIARQNLFKLWAHKEGWPAKTKDGYDIGASIEFIRAYKEAARLQKEAGPHADLKERKLEAECKILDKKYEILEGNTIPMEEHLSELAVHAGMAMNVFRGFMELCKAVGVGPELVKQLEELIDKSLGMMRAEIEEKEGENAGTEL